MRMICHRCKIAILVGMILSCVLLSSCAFLKPGRGKIQAETWLPADTVALVSIPDVQEAKEKWKKTASGQAWNAPEMDYYLSQQFNPVMSAICEKAGIRDSQKILSLISGETVLALELPTDGGQSARKPVVYAIADFGRNADEARQLVEESLPDRQRSDKGIRIQHEWIGSRLVLVSSGTKLKDLQDRRKAQKALFFGKRKREALPALSSNEMWRRMQDYRLRNTDALLYVDVNRIYGAASQFAQKRMTENKKGVQWIGLNLFIKSLGADDLQAVLTSLEMRDKAFFTRTAITYRDGASGILVPLKDPKPLQTPGWMTKDVEAFTATRIHPPAEMRDLFLQTVRTEIPFIEKIITSAMSNLEKKSGFDLDALLGAFGSEIALFSDSKSAAPVKAVLLWEIRDQNALDKIFATTTQKWKGTVEQRSFAGYTYEARKFGSMPFPIYTAQIGNFLMISAQDDWIKNFVSRKEGMAKVAASGKELDGEMPVGADSLLPVLKAPFDEPPKNYVVTARAYQDPAPALRQMSAVLPLALPFVNSQLKQKNMPAIPTWVTGTVPPMAPFAQASFPTVARVMQEDQKVVIKEVYSAFNPLASPFAAMGVAIAGHHLLEPQSK